MTTSTLANTDLLGVPADTWAAWGIWATLAVYSAIAYLALRQVREARSLRLEQSRPFVAVDAKFRNIALFLSVKNIGRTAAEDVQVRLDHRLTSAHEQINQDLGFQDASLFAGSMPLMAPERELLYLLDRFPDRADSDLPMTISGTVEYRGHGATEPYQERFEIDLSIWIGSRLPDKGVPELVEAVEHLKVAVDAAAGAYALTQNTGAGVMPRKAHCVTAEEHMERTLADSSTPSDLVRDDAGERGSDVDSLQAQSVARFDRLRELLTIRKRSQQTS